MLYGLLGQREPAARVLRVLRVLPGWSVAAVGLLAAVGCVGSPTTPTTSTAPQFITYTGEVFQPQISETDGQIWGPTGSIPIPGARVTIIGGQPDGWTTLTDAEGRFAFEDYPYCELESVECYVRRFRVEKAGYETRELRASDPYRTIGHSDLSYSPRKKNIPIGLEWPADPETQRMRRDLPAMSPLWLIELPEYRFPGTYGGNVVIVRNREDLHAVGHEYCHAHQDWSVDPARTSSYGERWLQAPEGRAFLAAWEADWSPNDPFLEYIEVSGLRARIKRPEEEAAEICTYYFYDLSAPFLGVTIGRRYLRDRVPHLHAWAEEWLRWR